MAAEISLMAAGDLRDALTAAERGDAPAAIGALMSIDATSWEGIRNRLADLGATLPELLTHLGDTP
jgi:hypothetical protein